MHKWWIPGLLSLSLVRAWKVEVPSNIDNRSDNVVIDDTFPVLVLGVDYLF